MPDLKVLVPLDGSRLAEAVLEYLPLLERVANSGEADQAPSHLHVRLVSVVDESLAFGLPRVEDLQQREGHLLHEYLRMRAEALQRENFAVEIVVRQGAPASAVLAEGAAFASDMIILSTHGRSGVQRWRIGSVADKIVRAGTCDTMVVGPKAARPGITSIRSILVPLDGSELAEEALPRARILASALGARIFVTRVVSPQVISDDVYGFSVSPETMEMLLESTRGYLEQLSSQPGTPKLEVIAPIVAPVADQLLEVVAANSIDLVIMTSHGRGGVLRAAFGSITDRLLGEPAPVLVVRPGQAAGD